MFPWKPSLICWGFYFNNVNLHRTPGNLQFCFSCVIAPQGAGQFWADAFYGFYSSSVLHPPQSTGSIQLLMSGYRHALQLDSRKGALSEPMYVGTVGTVGAGGICSTLESNLLFWKLHPYLQEPSAHALLRTHYVHSVVSALPHCLSFTNSTVLSEYSSLLPRPLTWVTH